MRFSFYITILGLFSSFSALAEITKAEAAYLEGDYKTVLKLTARTYSTDQKYAPHESAWIRVTMESGKYREALSRANRAISRRPEDPEILLITHEALLKSGRPEEAQQHVDEFMQKHSPLPAFDDLVKPVHFGEVALLGGIDAKTVLRKYFQPAKVKSPKERDAYIAIGKLALAKFDKQLAGEIYKAARKQFPNDPEVMLGMFHCGYPLPEDLIDKEAKIETYLDLALKQKPNYYEALVLKAEILASNKKFTEAKAVLKDIYKLNEFASEALALECAIEMLEENPSKASRAWEKAQTFTNRNSKTPLLVGNSMAKHYRFAEAIMYLKKALDLDPKNPLILYHLGLNQIRFGEYDAGWKHITESHKLDAFNVACYNLVLLKDKIENYPVLERDGVQLRLSPEDAPIFGELALECAVKSKNILTKKYGVTLTQPVLLEMLAQQDDFAIRTLGLPGGESFLGVCFGPLITMTSPRGKLGRANWQTVVWHEMAHTITLEATKQRIPRWLTEGISVYEERQVQAGWGQGITGPYRQRILADIVPPISELNAAFHSPDILFAYYYSSLIVEYFMEEYGMEKMQLILKRIGNGEKLETVFSQQTGLSMKDFEKAFTIYAKQKADAYGRNLDWSPISDEDYAEFRNDPEAWMQKHPNHYNGTTLLLSIYIRKGEWEKVKDLAQAIIAKEPNNRESYNPYEVLAQACRALGDDIGEQNALQKLIELDSHKATAADRLLTLSEKLDDGKQLDAALKVLQTNPFMARAHRMIADHSAKNGNKKQAIASYRALTHLAPIDQSSIHFKLAKIIHETSPKEAKREVLKALEINPRFEEALELLIKLQSTK